MLRSPPCLSYVPWITFLAILTWTNANTDIKGSCEKLEIVERDAWRARPKWRAQNMYTPLNHVVICHTSGQQCRSKTSCIRRVQMIQTFHLDDRGWWDIAYNFLIAGDGRVYEGRGWSYVGAHSVNFNSNSIGIAFVGDFRDQEPTKAMLEAAQLLIDCGVKKGFLTPSREIHGARDVTCTESPGMGVYKHIMKWRNFRGGRITNYSCPVRDPDPKPTTDAPDGSGKQY